MNDARKLSFDLGEIYRSMRFTNPILEVLIPNTFSKGFDVTFAESQ